MTAIIASGGARKTDSDVDVIWIDTVSSFSYNFTATLTQHPIESGSTISDHIFINNNKFPVRGVIAAYPVIDSNGNTLFADNLVDKGNSGVNNKKGLYSAAPARTQYAFDLLVGMFNNKTPFTLIEELGRYDNCFITSLSIERTSEQAESLFVDMTVEQARVVSSAKTRVFAVNSEYQDRASSSTSSGNTSSDKKEGGGVVDAIKNSNTAKAGSDVADAAKLLYKVMNESAVPAEGDQ